MATFQKFVILGIGNLLMKDDGIGIHVIRRISEMDLPEGVEAIDGATFTLDLLPIFQDSANILVVDAVKGEGSPGDIYFIIPDDLIKQEERMLSLHQVGFLDVLDTAKRMGKCAEVSIMGIEPQEISWGMELSPILEEKLDRIVERVLDQMYDMLGRNKEDASND